MTGKDAIAPAKMARLQSFLGALPTASATKLFGVLEAGRARGPADLPYDDMLSTLREKLFEADATPPRRVMTAQRWFFEPFEDFFIAERRGKKRRARIARSSLSPIWSLMMTDPACSGAARAARTLDDAITQSGAADAALAREIEAPSESFFNAAGEGMRRVIAHAEANEAYRADLAARLGGAGAYHDFVELHLMLSGAEHLKRMQDSFKKPVSVLTEDDLYRVRKLYAAAYSEAPDAAPYVLLCLAGRMHAPWRALSIYYHLRDASDPDLPQASGDAMIIADVLFEDLEGMARSLERDAGAPFDAGEAGLKVRHFAEYADGMQDEATRCSDSVFVNRIEACRDVAAEALERFTELSVAAIRKAMPVRHAGGSSRLMALRPDIDRPVSPTLAREGREAADFVAKIADTMTRLKRKWSAGDLIEEATNYAKRYANDLVTEIRAAEGEERAAARRLMDHVLALISPLLPDTEVGLIRERANAAALSA